MWKMCGFHPASTSPIDNFRMIRARILAVELQGMCMLRPTVARNAIGPLLDQLIYQLEHEGSATQCAYFNRIRRSLNGAHDDFELINPIQALSTTPAVGFAFSQDADLFF